MKLQNTLTHIHRKCMNIYPFQILDKATGFTKNRQKEEKYV